MASIGLSASPSSKPNPFAGLQLAIPIDGIDLAADFSNEDIRLQHRYERRQAALEKLHAKLNATFNNAATISGERGATLTSNLSFRGLGLSGATNAGGAGMAGSTNNNIVTSPMFMANINSPAFANANANSNTTMNNTIMMSGGKGAAHASTSALSFSRGAEALGRLPSALQQSSSQTPSALSPPGDGSRAPTATSQPSNRQQESASKMVLTASSTADSNGAPPTPTTATTAFNATFGGDAAFSGSMSNTADSPHVRQNTDAVAGAGARGNLNGKDKVDVRRPSSFSANPDEDRSQRSPSSPANENHTNTNINAHANASSSSGPPLYDDGDKTVAPTPLPTAEISSPPLSVTSPMQQQQRVAKIEEGTKGEKRDTTKNNDCFKTGGGEGVIGTEEEIPTVLSLVNSQNSGSLHLSSSSHVFGGSAPSTTANVILVPSKGTTDTATNNNVSSEDGKGDVDKTTNVVSVTQTGGAVVDDASASASNARARHGDHPLASGGTPLPEDEDGSEEGKLQRRSSTPSSTTWRGVSEETLIANAEAAKAAEESSSVAAPRAASAGPGQVSSTTPRDAFSSSPSPTCTASADGTTNPPEANSTTEKCDDKNDNNEDKLRSSQEKGNNRAQDHTLSHSRGGDEDCLLMEDYDGEATITGTEPGTDRSGTGFAISTSDDDGFSFGDEDGARPKMRAVASGCNVAGGFSHSHSSADEGRSRSGSEVSSSSYSAPSVDTVSGTPVLKPKPDTDGTKSHRTKSGGSRTKARKEKPVSDKGRRPTVSGESSAAEAPPLPPALPLTSDNFAQNINNPNRRDALQAATQLTSQNQPQQHPPLCPIHRTFTNNTNTTNTNTTNTNTNNTSATGSRSAVTAAPSASDAAPLIAGLTPLVSVGNETNVGENNYNNDGAAPTDSELGGRCRVVPSLPSTTDGYPTDEVHTAATHGSRIGNYEHHEHLITNEGDNNAYDNMRESSVPPYEFEINSNASDGLRTDIDLDSSHGEGDDDGGGGLFSDSDDSDGEGSRSTVSSTASEITRQQIFKDKKLMKQSLYNMTNLLANTVNGGNNTLHRAMAAAAVAAATNGGSASGASAAQSPLDSVGARPAFNSAAVGSGSLNGAQLQLLQLQMQLTGNSSPAGQSGSSHHHHHQPLHYKGGEPSAPLTPAQSTTIFSIIGADKSGGDTPTASAFFAVSPSSPRGGSTGGGGQGDSTARRGAHQQFPQFPSLPSHLMLSTDVNLDAAPNNLTTTDQNASAQQSQSPNRILPKKRGGLTSIASIGGDSAPLSTVTDIDMGARTETHEGADKPAPEDATTGEDDEYPLALGARSASDGFDVRGGVGGLTTPPQTLRLSTGVDSSSFSPSFPTSPMGTALGFSAPSAGGDRRSMTQMGGTATDGLHGEPLHPRSSLSMNSSSNVPPPPHVSQSPLTLPTPDSAKPAPSGGSSSANPKKEATGANNNSSSGLVFARSSPLEGGVNSSSVLARSLKFGATPLSGAATAVVGGAAVETTPRAAGERGIGTVAAKPTPLILSASEPPCQQGGGGATLRSSTPQSPRGGVALSAVSRDRKKGSVGAGKGQQQPASPNIVTGTSNETATSNINANASGGGLMRRASTSYALGSDGKLITINPSAWGGGEGGPAAKAPGTTEPNPTDEFYDDDDDYMEEEEESRPETPIITTVAVCRTAYDQSREEREAEARFKGDVLAAALLASKGLAAPRPPTPPPPPLSMLGGSTRQLSEAELSASANSYNRPPALTGNNNLNMSGNNNNTNNSEGGSPNANLPGTMQHSPQFQRGTMPRQDSYYRGTNNNNMENNTYYNNNNNTQYTYGGGGGGFEGNFNNTFANNYFGNGSFAYGQGLSNMSLGGFGGGGGGRASKGAREIIVFLGNFLKDLPIPVAVADHMCFIEDETKAIFKDMAAKDVERLKKYENDCARAKAAAAAAEQAAKKAIQDREMAAAAAKRGEATSPPSATAASAKRFINNLFSSSKASSPEPSHAAAFPPAPPPLFTDTVDPNAAQHNSDAATGITMDLNASNAAVVSPATTAPGSPILPRTQSSYAPLTRGLSSYGGLGAGGGSSRSFSKPAKPLPPFCVKIKLTQSVLMVPDVIEAALAQLFFGAEAVSCTTNGTTKSETSSRQATKAMGQTVSARTVGWDVSWLLAGGDERIKGLLEEAIVLVQQVHQKVLPPPSAASANQDTTAGFRSPCEPSSPSALRGGGGGFHLNSPLADRGGGGYNTSINTFNDSLGLAPPNVPPQHTLVGVGGSESDSASLAKLNSGLASNSLPPTMPTATQIEELYAQAAELFIEEKQRETLQAFYRTALSHSPEDYLVYMADEYTGEEDMILRTDNPVGANYTHVLIKPLPIAQKYLFPRFQQCFFPSARRAAMLGGGGAQSSSSASSSAAGGRVSASEFVRLEELQRRDREQAQKRSNGTLLLSLPDASLAAAGVAVAPNSGDKNLGGEGASTPQKGNGLFSTPKRAAGILASSPEQASDDSGATPMSPQNMRECTLGAGNAALLAAGIANTTSASSAASGDAVPPALAAASSVVQALMLSVSSGGSAAGTVMSPPTQDALASTVTPQVAARMPTPPPLPTSLAEVPATPAPQSDAASSMFSPEAPITDFRTVQMRIVQLPPDFVAAACRILRASELASQGLLLPGYTNDPLIARSAKNTPGIGTYREVKAMSPNDLLNTNSAWGGSAALTAPPPTIPIAAAGSPATATIGGGFVSSSILTVGSASAPPLAYSFDGGSEAVNEAVATALDALHPCGLSGAVRLPPIPSTMHPYYAAMCEQHERQLFSTIVFDSTSPNTLAENAAVQPQPQTSGGEPMASSQKQPSLANEQGLPSETTSYSHTVSPMKIPTPPPINGGENDKNGIESIGANVSSPTRKLPALPQTSSAAELAMLHHSHVTTANNSMFLQHHNPFGPTQTAAVAIFGPGRTLTPSAGFGGFGAVGSGGRSSATPMSLAGVTRVASGRTTAAGIEAGAAGSATDLLQLNKVLGGHLNALAASAIVSFTHNLDVEAKKLANDASAKAAVDGALPQTPVVAVASASNAAAAGPASLHNRTHSLATDGAGSPLSVASGGGGNGGGRRGLGGFRSSHMDLFGEFQPTTSVNLAAAAAASGALPILSPRSMVPPSAPASVSPSRGGGGGASSPYGNNGFSPNSAIDVSSSNNINASSAAFPSASGVLGPSTVSSSYLTTTTRSAFLVSAALQQAQQNMRLCAKRMGGDYSKQDLYAGSVGGGSAPVNGGGSRDSAAAGGRGGSFSTKTQLFGATLEDEDAWANSANNTTFMTAADGSTVAVVVDAQAPAYFSASMPKVTMNDVPTPVTSFFSANNRDRFLFGPRSQIQMANSVCSSTSVAFANDTIVTNPMVRRSPSRTGGLPVSGVVPSASAALPTATLTTTSFAVPPTIVTGGTSMALTPVIVADTKDKENKTASVSEEKGGVTDHVVLHRPESPNTVFGQTVPPHAVDQGAAFLAGEVKSAGAIPKTNEVEDNGVTRETPHEVAVAILSPDPSEGVKTQRSVQIHESALSKGGGGGVASPLRLNAGDGQISSLAAPSNTSFASQLLGGSSAFSLGFGMSTNNQNSTMTANENAFAASLFEAAPAAADAFNRQFLAKHMKGIVEIALAAADAVQSAAVMVPSALTTSPLFATTSAAQQQHQRTHSATPPPSGAGNAGGSGPTAAHSVAAASGVRIGDSGAVVFTPTSASVPGAVGPSITIVSPTASPYNNSSVFGAIGGVQHRRVCSGGAASSGAVTPLPMPRPTAVAPSSTSGAGGGVAGRLSGFFAGTAGGNPTTNATSNTSMGAKPPATPVGPTSTGGTTAISSLPATILPTVEEYGSLLVKKGTTQAVTTETVLDPVRLVDVYHAALAIKEQMQAANDSSSPDGTKSIGRGTTSQRSKPRTNVQPFGFRSGALPSSSAAAAAPRHERVLSGDGLQPRAAQDPFGTPAHSAAGTGGIPTEASPSAHNVTHAYSYSGSGLEVGLTALVPQRLTAQAFSCASTAPMPRVKTIVTMVAAGHPLRSRLIVPGPLSLGLVAVNESAALSIEEQRSLHLSASTSKAPPASSTTAKPSGANGTAAGSSSAVSVTMMASTATPNTSPALGASSSLAGMPSAATLLHPFSAGHMNAFALGGDNDLAIAQNANYALTNLNRSIVAQRYLSSDDVLMILDIRLTLPTSCSFYKTYVNEHGGRGNITIRRSILLPPELTADQLESYVLKEIGIDLDLDKALKAAKIDLGAMPGLAGGSNTSSQAHFGTSPTQPFNNASLEGFDDCDESGLNDDNPARTAEMLKAKAKADKAKRDLLPHILFVKYGPLLELSVDTPFDFFAAPDTSVAPEWLFSPPPPPVITKPLSMAPSPVMGPQHMNILSPDRGDGGLNRGTSSFNLKSGMQRQSSFGMGTGGGGGDNADKAQQQRHNEAIHFHLTNLAHVFQQHKRMIAEVQQSARSSSAMFVPMIRDRTVFSLKRLGVDSLLIDLTKFSEDALKFTISLLSPEDFAPAPTRSANGAHNTSTTSDDGASVSRYNHHHGHSAINLGSMFGDGEGGDDATSNVVLHPQPNTSRHLSIPRLQIGGRDDDEDSSCYSSRASSLGCGTAPVPTSRLELWMIEQCWYTPSVVKPTALTSHLYGRGGDEASFLDEQLFMDVAASGLAGGFGVGAGGGTDFHVNPDGTGARPSAIASYTRNHIIAQNAADEVPLGSGLTKDVRNVLEGTSTSQAQSQGRYARQLQTGNCLNSSITRDYLAHLNEINMRSRRQPLAPAGFGGAGSPFSGPLGNGGGSPSRGLGKLGAGGGLFTRLDEDEARAYQHFEVIKTNKYGTEQERVIGIDGERIYNMRPSSEAAGKTKNPERNVGDIETIRTFPDRPRYFEIEYKREARFDTDRILCKSVEDCVLMVEKLKVLKKMESRRAKSGATARTGDSSNAANDATAVINSTRDKGVFNRVKNIFGIGLGKNK